MVSSTSECLSPIIFYTVNYTHRRSSDPKGVFPSFKTLDFVAEKMSAENLTYASKFRKFIKEKMAADYFGGPPKINGGN